jgi:hypothetical protein
VYSASNVCIFCERAIHGLFVQMKSKQLTFDDVNVLSAVSPSIAR